MVVIFPAHRSSTTSDRVGCCGQLLAPVLGPLRPILGSLVEPRGKYVSIDRRDNDRRSARLEKFETEFGIGGSSCDGELSVPVGGGNDALACDKHVGMTQVADVPQINRQVVHPDVQYVDPIDRRNRARILDALGGFEQDVDRRRAIGGHHHFRRGEFAIARLRQECDLRTVSTRWEARGIDDADGKPAPEAVQVQFRPSGE